MDEKRKQDLEDVIRKETRRWRRPIDLDARRKRDQMLSDFRKLLTSQPKRNLFRLCVPSDSATALLSFWTL